MGDQNALFSQYETEYCNNSTEIARNLQAISTISIGEQGSCLGTGIADFQEYYRCCCSTLADVRRFAKPQNSGAGSCGKQRQQ